MSLKRYLIGETLESFRQYRNLSIQDLSKDICSEDELIAFEKEKAYPSLENLDKLAERLDIDLTYFFNVATNSTINYSNAVIRIINKHKRYWNYHAIYEIVQKELTNPIFQTGALKQFLIWHQGIVVFYLENDFAKAINLLNEAINITNPNRRGLNEREIEILTSIAILCKEEENYGNAISIFKDALRNLEKLPYILEPKGKLKALFGLSQALTETEEYNESLIYCQKGIDLCINEELLYLFANFHYQAGENHIKLGNKEKGREFLNESIYILKMQKNDKFIKIIETEMEKLLYKC